MDTLRAPKTQSAPRAPAIEWNVPRRKVHLAVSLVQSSHPLENRVSPGLRLCTGAAATSKSARSPFRVFDTKMPLEGSLWRVGASRKIDFALIEGGFLGWRLARYVLRGDLNIALGIGASCALCTDGIKVDSLAIRGSFALRLFWGSLMQRWYFEFDG